MKNKSEEELRRDYYILTKLIEFQQTIQPPLMNAKELEDYTNSALDMMLEIRHELKKRGKQI